jgi:hypothetical protein
MENCKIGKNNLIPNKWKKWKIAKKLAWSKLGHDITFENCQKC